VNTAPHITHTRRGVTLVEVLVVIALIGLLLTLIIVGLDRAFGYAKTAAAEAQLRGIGQAIEAFETDIGYLPPLVTEIRDSTIQTPETLARFHGDDLADAYQRARYMSEFSLAVYLVGVGELDFQEDIDGDDGLTAAGLRHPGPTGAWKSTNRGEDFGAHMPTTTGRVYGPYLETDEGLLDRVEVGFDSAENRLVVEEGSNRFMHRMLDPWGNPIRYYRNAWQKIDPVTGRATVEFAPPELRSYEGARQQIELSQTWEDVDVTFDSDVMNAPYLLLSAGERPGQIYDRTGQPLEGYGDVILTSNDARLELDLNVPGSSSFMPWTFNTGAGSIASDTYLRFLKSNVRYAP